MRPPRWFAVRRLGWVALLGSPCFLVLLAQTGDVRFLPAFAVLAGGGVALLRWDLRWRRRDQRERWR